MSSLVNFFAAPVPNLTAPPTGYIPGYLVDDDNGTARQPQILFPIENDVILNSVSAMDRRGVYLLSNNTWHTPAAVWMPPVPTVVRAAIEARPDAGPGGAIVRLTPTAESDGGQRYAADFVEIAATDLLESVPDAVYLFRAGALRPFSYHPPMRTIAGSFHIQFTAESSNTPGAMYYSQATIPLDPPLAAGADYTFLLDLRTADTSVFTSTSWTEPIIVSDVYFSAAPDILHDSFVYAIWSYDSRRTSSTGPRPGKMQLITVTRIVVPLSALTIRTRGSLRFAGSIDVQWRLQAIQNNDVYPPRRNG